jgi:hypothetical protein
LISTQCDSEFFLELRNLYRLSIRVLVGAISSRATHTACHQVKR